MTITLGRAAGVAANACAKGRAKSERRVMAVADMTYLDIADVGWRSSGREAFDLFEGPHMRQADLERGRKRLLNFRVDKTGLFKILDVGLIFQPETGELHVHQIGKRKNTDSVFNDGSRIQRRDGFDVIFAHFFAGENKVHSAAERRLIFRNKHIDSPGVAVFHTIRVDGSYYGWEVVSPNGNIDVFCKTACVGLEFFDIKIGGQATNDAIVEVGFPEGPVDGFRQFEEVLQACLEECIDEYSHAFLYCIRTTSQ